MVLALIEGCLQNLTETSGYYTISPRIMRSRNVKDRGSLQQGHFHRIPWLWAGGTYFSLYDKQLCVLKMTLTVNFIFPLSRIPGCVDIIYFHIKGWNTLWNQHKFHRIWNNLGFINQSKIIEKDESFYEINKSLKFNDLGFVSESSFGPS